MAGNGDDTDLDLCRKGLGQILIDHTLIVPVNQRPYAWNKEHVTDLFTDFQNAIDADLSEDERHDRDYFLGTIVLTRGDKKGTLEVADGQQRLATATILLAAIRDYLYEKGDKRHQKIEQQYLIDDDLITQEPVAKLSLNVNDKGFFADRILAPPNSPERKASLKQNISKDPRESHKKLADAAAQAKTLVHTLAASRGAEGIDYLLRWVLFIRSNARVILFIVPDHSDAFVIFETLNDRGLELSKSDLLKNYLFGRAGDARFKEVQYHWTMMEGALETSPEDDITVTYIRHLWISLHGATRDKELYKKIKGIIRNSKSAGDFAERLAKEATTYVGLLNPIHHPVWTPYPPHTRDAAALIRQMGWKQIRPLMLAVIRALSPKEAERAFRAFVSWSVRFLIVGGLGTGSVEDAFAECAKKVAADDNKKVKTAEAIFVELSSVLPSDEEFKGAFATARVSRPYLARYYLHAMEAYKRDERCPESINKDDPRAISLEHVAPQEREDGWKHIDDDTYPSLVKRIGNLALLKVHDNSERKSDEFADKLPFYKTSVYALTQDLTNYPDTKWTKDDIDKRQAKLAAIAVKTWPLRPPK